MKILIKYFVVSTLFSLSSIALAGNVVIVHPKNSAQISLTDVKQLYLAKTKTFSDGSLAIPINLPEGEGKRVAFDKNVLSKSPKQIKAYWAKLVFSGEETPLRVVQSDAEVVELVTKNESVIGYIDAANVTDAVKVVSEF